MIVVGWKNGEPNSARQCTAAGPADGMLSGRPVREGEVIGKVGNFFKRERATTYHLHFDLQVPT